MTSTNPTYIINTGYVAHNGSGTFYGRTHTATANQFSVADGDGQSGNATFGLSDNPIWPGTEGVTLPKGTTAERPGTPVEGMLRFNTDTNLVEYYNGTQWVTYSSLDGKWELIQSQTASSSASIDFTTFPNTYNGYYIVYDNIVPASATTELRFQFSSDGGASYVNTNYLWGSVYVRMNGATASNQTNGTVTDSSMYMTSQVLDGLSTTSGKMFIWDMSATKWSVAQCEYVLTDQSSNEFSGRNTGVLQSNTAMNAFRFIMGTGNITSGTFKLYGWED